MYVCPHILYIYICMSLYIYMYVYIYIYPCLRMLCFIFSISSWTRSAMLWAEESLPSYKAWAKENNILMPKTRKESCWIRSRLSLTGFRCDLINGEFNKWAFNQHTMGLYRNIMEYHRNAMEIHGSFPLNDEMIHGGHRGFPYRFAKRPKTVAICGRGWSK